MKIFISYSSLDKVFASRLALDLLAAGLPVWLDVWEMEIGDSLYQKIFSGLDSSSYVIIVVSRNYNRSIWTSKEFRAVLSKEDNDQRKILLPLVIDDAEVPLEIRDRIYSNFSVDYDLKIMQLKRFFSVQNIGIHSLALSQRLIPIVFREYLHLETQILITILEDRNTAEEISQKQLWFKDLETMYSLMIKIKNLIDPDPAIHFQLKAQLRNDLVHIEKLIGFMYRGTEIILNAYVNNNNIHFVSISLYWHYRHILEMIYSILSRYADLREQFDLNIDPKELTYNSFSNNHSFCRFYGIKDTRSLVVFDQQNDNHCTFFIDKENYASKQLDDIPFPGRLHEFWNIDLVYKYMIPQNVFGYLLNPGNQKIMSEFSRYSLGVS